MPLRLLPWSPEYGSGLEAEPSGGDGDEDAAGAVDASIEGAWEARRPRGEPPAAVQIVDGVRRVEAHAIDDGGEDGAIAFGLFGSWAVGAVRCEGARSRVLDADAAGGGGRLRVGRVYLQGGGDPRPVEVEAGGSRLRFEPRAYPDGRAPGDLANALNRRMLDEEALLAASLADGEEALTIVDGPLRLGSEGRRVAGYVKRVQRWYLPPREFALLAALEVGERTPLFRIAGGGEAGSRGGPDRFAWYLRIAGLGPRYHHLASVVRLEAPGALPPGEAAALADETALALPRLASSPVRDPRAPQNLTPVGALEDVLRRRLGDRRWLRRRIEAALGPEAAAPHLGPRAALAGNAP